MITAAKRLYFHLPMSARGAAASAYGLYLRWWRYGPDTEELVDAALARESWSTERWEHYHEEQLAPLLHRAATRVPAYRDAWQRRRRQGDTASWEELANWPVLTKRELQQRPGAYLADDVDRRRMFKVRTSGSSGSPLAVWRSRAAMRRWYALFEARSRRWYGVSARSRWVLLGGQVVAPAQQTRPPFWVYNAPLRQLYMSSLHISPANVEGYLHAIRDHGVEYMVGYSSAMYWLARFALDRGVEVPRLAVAVSNAEPLYPHQRRVIAEAFGCPVRETYGMVEAVAAAGECAHGALHLWPEVGVTEVVGDDDQLVSHGAVGRLICTGLLNPDMPLIRYEVGDRGALGSGTPLAHPCGRHLPVLAGIEGRLTDTIVTADGRRIVSIGPIFQSTRVREAQMIQEAIGRVRVKVVPDTGFDASDAHEITRRARQRLGDDLEIEVDVVDAIPRGPNGKVRALVNRLDA